MIEWLLTCAYGIYLFGNSYIMMSPYTIEAYIK